MVLVTGIEPVRRCRQGILSPWRLPVPPHQHFFSNMITHTEHKSKCFSGKSANTAPLNFTAGTPRGAPFPLTFAAGVVYTVLANVFLAK